MQRPFYLMAKPSAAHCNMCCEYCFYSGTNHSNSIRMSDQVLEKYIKNYINSNPQRQISFIWQGGEPTLYGLDFFKKAVALEQKYANGKKIYNSLQTNGLLINQEWCDFFKEHDFLVGISIDGPQEIHDKRRKDHHGKGTFSQVINSINRLIQTEVEFNTLTVINKANVHKGADVYAFLKEIGSKQMQFIPLTGVEETITPADYGRFMIDIFNSWYPQDIGKIFIQHIEQWFMAYANISPTLCIFRPYCGDQLIIEQNGDIFSCDHFVDQEHRLGNIREEPLLSLINKLPQVQFGLSKAALPACCRTCNFLKYCNGGCPKHRVTNEKGEKVNQFCDAYKQALTYMLPYFAKIYQSLSAK